MGYEGKQSARDFYDALNDQQKERVEEKLNRMVKQGSQVAIDETTVHSIRCQIAQDMFYILKG